MNDPNTFDPNAPTDELISFALSHPPTEEWEDPHWDAIRELRGRCTREVFHATARLIESECPSERALGVRVLAQLGAPEYPFGAESVALLNVLLESEQHVEVIQAVLFAFGHIQRKGCFITVVPFANHSAPEVRLAVAFALGGCDDPLAIGTQIGLSSDADRDVRDWATFALGSLNECDSPELRAALWARLGDSDNETRGEALKGLALRKDERAIGAIIAELGGPDPHEYAVEAAGELADPRFVPALEALRTRWAASSWLDSVIEECRAGKPQ